MNENIKKLIEQTDIYCDQHWLNHPFYDVKWEEKFAELIIQECMGVARGMRNPPNLNYKPSDRFVDELRLHFGVES